MARLSIAANHDLRLLHGLYLQPVATTLLHVRTRDTLGYHSFEGNFFYLAIQLLAGADDVIREANVAGWLQQLLQERLAIEQTAAREIEAIEIYQIKDVVSDARLPDQAFDLDRVLATHALLQQLKSRHAVFIERDDFAIENRASGRDRLHYARELRILRREIVLVARNKSRLAAVDEADGADTVPLG